MDPEPSADDKYEGFFSAVRRDAARRQRALMFEWRLLCSEQNPELVRHYGQGQGLSFDEGQRLEADLRTRSDVLPWRRLQAKAGKSLSHYVSGKYVRAPSIETLVEMAEVGGGTAVAALLRQREQLTDVELRRLRKSPDAWARVQSLAPELLPADEVPMPTPVVEDEICDHKPDDAVVVQLPLPEVKVVPKRPSGYFDWESFLKEGGPIGFEVDTFDHRCLDIWTSRWRDDCQHDPAPLDYSTPAYLSLMSGHVHVDDVDGLTRDLRLDTDQADVLRKSVRWWYGQRWGAAAVQLHSLNVSSRILDNLFPDHSSGAQIQAGYRLLQSLFFPQHLQDGWEGPIKKTMLGGTVIRQYYGPSARTPSSWLKVRVASLEPPTVYLHLWPALSPKELLWGRIARDLWGGVLGYCRKDKGHWFFAHPGQRTCGVRGHWGGGVFVLEGERDDFYDIPQFPDNLLDQVIELPSDDEEFLKGMEQVIRGLGPLDERFVEPPLAKRDSDIDSHRSLKTPPGLDHQLAVMKDLLKGIDPDRRLDYSGSGVFHLFQMYEPALPDGDPPWPHFVQYGGIFPEIRLFSELPGYPEPTRYAPASLPQLVTEAVASEVIEMSAEGIALRWGPFWCARPGCASLFVAPKLQRDLRACVVPSGFRSLMLSQYCSHACFIADKPGAKPSLNELSWPHALPDVRTFVEGLHLVPAAKPRKTVGR